MQLDNVKRKIARIAQTTEQNSSPINADPEYKPICNLFEGNIRKIVNIRAPPTVVHPDYAPTNYPKQVRNQMFDVSDIEGAVPRSPLQSVCFKKVPATRNGNLDVSDINMLSRQDCVAPTFKTRSNRSFNFYEPVDINGEHGKLHKERDPQEPIYDWANAEQFGPEKKEINVKSTDNADPSLRTVDIAGKYEATLRMRQQQYGERKETHDLYSPDDINGDAYKSAGYSPTRVKCGGARSRLLRDKYANIQPPSGLVSDHQNDVLNRMRSINAIREENPEPQRTRNDNDEKSELSVNKSPEFCCAKAPSVFVCHESVGVLPGPPAEIYTNLFARYESNIE